MRHAGAAPGWCGIISGVNRVQDLRKLRRYVDDLRAEQLHKLRFRDAMQQVLDLSAFSMDLVVSFSSAEDLIRLQNSSLPMPRRRSDGKRLSARP